MYDELYSYLPISEIVERVSSLAAPGATIIEFAAATGIVATALADSGFIVTATETARSFIDAQRERDPFDRVQKLDIDVVAGEVSPVYDLALMVNNALNALVDEADQSSALATMASSIGPKGHVIIETFSPLPFMTNRPGESHHAALPNGNALLFDNIIPSFETQHLLFQRSLVRGGHVSSYGELARYLWPSELDLMAEKAGLTLRSRASSWQDGAFTLDKPSVISIYGRLSRLTAS